MRTTRHSRFSRYFAAAAVVAALSWAGAAQAHCDTLDGPVVSQARTALESGNLNPVLAWVRRADEPEIRHAFEQAVSVRKAGGAARELADRSFFETLVRVHRAGEGEPFTGLKPAGHVEPAVAAADQALRSGRLEPLAAMIRERTEHGLHQRFQAAFSTRTHAADDVEAARAHVAAYVQYVHYVEGLYDAAQEDAAHGEPAPSGVHGEAALQH